MNSTDDTGLPVVCARGHSYQTGDSHFDLYLLRQQVLIIHNRLNGLISRVYRRRVGDLEYATAVCGSDGGRQGAYHTGVSRSGVTEMTSRIGNVFRLLKLHGPVGSGRVGGNSYGRTRGSAGSRNPWSDSAWKSGNGEIERVSRATSRNGIRERGADAADHLIAGSRCGERERPRPRTRSPQSGPVPTEGRGNRQRR